MSFARLRLASFAVVTAGALVLTGCGSDENDTGGNDNNGGDPSASGSAPAAGDLSGTLAGAGATSQEAAQEAWRANFKATNPDVTVNYDAIGSGGGVEQFLQGATAFGGTDAVLTDDELEQAKEVCGDGGAMDLPVYISPIAVVFNIPDIDSLNMSAETIADIFNHKITKWNDDAIAEENPDADLPDLDINTVNRSDDSGTTENFTDYLSQAAGDAWPHEPAETWPVGGGQSGDGTSGLVQTVKAAEGTIGYADASQAGGLGTVAVKVGEDYVPYSPEGAAKVVDASKQMTGRPEHDLAYELDRTTTADGAYPIVLVSYAMACTSYDDANTAELVKAYLTYISGPDGQKVASQSAGSAPISDALRAKVTQSIESINAG